MAVASVNAAASSASSVVVWRIVRSRRDSSVSARALGAPVEGAHAVALRPPRERLGVRRVGQPQRGREVARPPARRDRGHVGRVGPAAVVGAGGGADADDAQAPRRGALADDDAVAGGDGVVAGVAAPQHDLARAADAAPLEDHRVLDLRARAREPDQPDGVALPVHARGHLGDRPRALGGHDAALRRDRLEVRARRGDGGDVRAVGGREEAVVGVVERRAAVQGDDERAEREGDDEPGEDGGERPRAEVGADDAGRGGEHDQASRLTTRLSASPCTVDGMRLADDPPVAHRHHALRPRWPRACRG